jgi:hypothetical protein
MWYDTRQRKGRGRQSKQMPAAAVLTDLGYTQLEASRVQHVAAIPESVVQSVRLTL